MQTLKNNTFVRCGCLINTDTFRKINSVIISHLYIIHMNIFLKMLDSNNDCNFH